MKGVHRIQVCLMAICECNGIPVTRIGIMNSPFDGTEDQSTVTLSTIPNTHDNTTKLSSTSRDSEISDNIHIDRKRGQRQGEDGGHQVLYNLIHNLSKNITLSESESLKDLSTSATVKDVDSRSSASSDDVTVSMLRDSVSIDRKQHITTDNNPTKNTEIGNDIQDSNTEKHIGVVQTINVTTRQGQHRTGGICLGLNQKQEDLCRLAVIAVSQLDELYLAVKTVFIRQHFYMKETTPQDQIDGDCTVNVSQMTSDLWTAVTAVCLLENVTNMNQPVGGCCPGNSHIKEQFQNFIVFLEVNVFHQRNAVDPICLESNINVMWLVDHVMSTLQNTKKVLLGIESGRCQIF